jgi:hypothetical protein
MSSSHASKEGSLALPFALDPNQANATFSNGVLSISPPKLPDAGAGSAASASAVAESTLAGARPGASRDLPIRFGFLGTREASTKGLED